MRFKIGTATASLLLLAACSTANTVYGPIDKSGIGFQEQKIESNRYSVVFTGDTDAPSSLVEKYALRRAAEITLDNGADWFRVASKSTYKVGGSSNRGTNVGVSAGGGSRGYSGVGVGIGIDLTPDRSSFESRLEILTGVGDLPTEDKDTLYDAKSVLENAITPVETDS